MNSENNDTLEILIKKSQGGNKEAFRGIYEKLNNRLFSYAFSHTSNRDDALDLTQETFVDIWNGMKNFKYKSDESFFAFCFLILKRKLFHHYKSKPATVSIEESFVEESYEMKVDDYRGLLKNINSLAEKYKDTLRLRYWSDMKLKDIATVLKTNEATVKVWHHRALKELKNNLGNYDNI